jgi:hypothetical protein
MLFKRGSTISAAEGGCQAEVGGEIELSNIPNWRYIKIRRLTASSISRVFNGGGRVRSMYGRQVNLQTFDETQIF